MKNKKVWIVISALLLTLLTACNYRPWTSPIQEDKPKQNIDTEAKQPPISPSTENVSQEEKTVTLYFGYAGQEYLASDTRKISVSATKRIEAAIVEELIKGPGAGKVDLQPLFDPQTKVLSVSDNKDYLFVTLSKEFLNGPELGEGQENQRNLAKRLAVYSIVNSLTELGQFSRIQILVGDNNNTEGERIKREDAGFVDPNSSQNDESKENKKKELLEPLGRSNDLILTPMNTMTAMLNAFTEKNWSGVYQFLASQDANGVAKPSEDDFKNAMVASDPTLESFQVLNESVSNDGQTAVVSISYNIRVKDGKMTENIDIPVKLVRENEIWKVAMPISTGIIENR